MSCCQAGAIDDYMDRALAAKELRSYRDRGPARTTWILLDALEEAGAGTGTLLDIGGGVGAIQHEFLRAGCPEVISVDASSAYLEAAREEARRQGHLDRLRQHHGDFVHLASDLPGADVVPLDRVICCYHDMDSLVRLSAERAKRLYGVVYPRDHVLTKLFVWFENAYHRLRGSEFRAFVHATEAVDAVVGSMRFDSVSIGRTLLWQVQIYRRSRSREARHRCSSSRTSSRPSSGTYTPGMNDAELERLRNVFVRYPEVAGVWLFGSRARGDARARSDVDLAVDPVDPRDDAARRRKLDMLADLVTAGFEDVDLVILDRNDPVLRFETIKENALVYAAPGYDPAEAFVQALRHYDDTARLREKVREAYFDRLLSRDR